jgi:hypothetical protein
MNLQGLSDGRLILLSALQRAARIQNIEKLHAPLPVGSRQVSGGGSLYHVKQCAAI